MAPKGQLVTQAPQLMHFSGSMTWTCLAAPVMASMGQFFRHLPQPLHFSGSMVGWGFSLLQMGQWWSTTWARYSSRKYFSVLWTGLQALCPRPHRAVLLMVSASSSSRSRSSSVPLLSMIRSRISSIRLVPSRQGTHADFYLSF